MLLYILYEVGGATIGWISDLENRQGDELRLILINTYLKLTIIITESSVDGPLIDAFFSSLVLRIFR